MKVVSIDCGRDPDQSADAKVALQALLEKIEAGELGPLEKWAFLFETTSKTDPSNVCTSSRDSGVTLNQFVYMIEASKLDMLLRARVDG